MRQRSAVVATTTFISVRLIRPSTGTKHSDFSRIGIRHGCVIKLPPLKDKEISL